MESILASEWDERLAGPKSRDRELGSFTDYLEPLRSWRKPEHIKLGAVCSRFQKALHYSRLNQWQVRFPKA